MNLVSKIIAGLGWTPIGKSIQIEVDDSAANELIGNSITAEIVRLHADGSATLKLKSPLDFDRTFIAEVVAVPRHSGFDFFRLVTWGYRS